MSKFVPVSKVEHAAQTWSRPKDYAFAATEALVPIVSLEVATAAVNMPLAFIKHEKMVQLVAVAGPQPGRNLFVGPDGKWLGAYIPGILRSFPFRLARVEGREDMALCIDDAHLGAGDDPIYDQSGNLARQVGESVNFLNAYEKSRQQTMFAASALNDAGVLTSWPIKARTPDGKESAFSGLHRVDEIALNGLDEATFLKLRKVGALPIAYAQLLSISRFEVLTRLSEFQARLAKAPAAKEKGLNLDFLREDDGNLVF